MIDITDPPTGHSTHTDIGRHEGSTASDSVHKVHSVVQRTRQSSARPPVIAEQGYGSGTQESTGGTLTD